MKKARKTLPIFTTTHIQKKKTHHTRPRTHTRRSDEVKRKREREWRTTAEREIEAGAAQRVRCLATQQSCLYWCFASETKRSGN